MVWLHVLILAVVQGITEFLPVSSSAHLVIGKELLGLDAPGVRFEVALHLGTLVSVALFYRGKIATLVRGVRSGSREAWRTVGLLAVSAVPAGVLWLFLGERIEAWFGERRTAAVAASGLLAATGAILLSTRWARRAAEEAVTPAHAWWMGCMQAVAVLPGISHSGSTIAVARHLGVRYDRAAEFSFLMSLPILAAAGAADLVRGGFGTGGGALGTAHYLVGALVAAATGYAAIGALVRLLCRGRLWIFGIYCLCAGAASLAWLLP